MRYRVATYLAACGGDITGTRRWPLRRQLQPIRLTIFLYGKPRRTGMTRLPVVSRVWATLQMESYRHYPQIQLIILAERVGV